MGSQYSMQKSRSERSSGHVQSISKDDSLQDHNAGRPDELILKLHARIEELQMELQKSRKESLKAQ